MSDHPSDMESNRRSIPLGYENETPLPRCPKFLQTSAEQVQAMSLSEGDEIIGAFGDNEVRLKLLRVDRKDTVWYRRERCLHTRDQLEEGEMANWNLDLRNWYRVNEAIPYTTAHETG